MSSYEVKLFRHTDVEYAQALLLRNEVLRIPLGLKYSRQDLENDRNDQHLGVFRQNEIVGCLILTQTDATTFKMRQVAVSTNFQRNGIGRLMINAAHQLARTRQITRIFCHAREEAVPFYQSMQYRMAGEKFFEIGIPHYHMEWCSEV
ncbi:MAG: GNAT family N-acetyltransferase [Chitinophagales bacterium]